MGCHGQCDEFSHEVFKFETPNPHEDLEHQNFSANLSGKDNKAYHVFLILIFFKKKYWYCDGLVCFVIFGVSLWLWANAIKWTSEDKAYTLSRPNSPSTWGMIYQMVFYNWKAFPRQLATIELLSTIGLVCRLTDKAAQRKIRFLRSSGMESLSDEGISAVLWSKCFSTSSTVFTQEWGHVFLDLFYPNIDSPS